MSHFVLLIQRGTVHWRTTYVILEKKLLHVIQNYYLFSCIITRRQKETRGTMTLKE
jgi:hypothetical protein